LYVFDAGAGVERRIMEATPKLNAADVQKFGPVFISHLDKDHTIGLGALLMYHNLDALPSRGGGPPTNPGLRTGGGNLAVYGPGPARGAHGIAEIMGNLAAAFENKVFSERIRVDELGSSALPFQSFDLKPGIVYKDPAITVTAFEVDHKTPIAFGFRIQTMDRVIVISGDTRPVDAVVDACNGCDLLFHEVYGLDYGPVGPRGNAQGHTSAVELGMLAQRARPKRLVIYHDVNAPQEMALPLIKKGFGGEVTFARDLDVF
jgi:ribonuclease BN (tRNA processing enzyme)